MAKQTPPNGMNIVCFRLKRALTALIQVYKIKKNLYIYNVRNFPPYPIWDIISYKLKQYIISF